MKEEKKVRLAGWLTEVAVSSPCLHFLPVSFLTRLETCSEIWGGLRTTRHRLSGEKSGAEEHFSDQRAATTGSREIFFYTDITFLLHATHGTITIHSSGQIT